MAEILSEFGHLVGLAGGNNIQATTMPTYSSVPLGTIVQYIGTTTADYINGYFYKATATGWEQHDTQPASNADNSITAFKESSPAQAAHAVDDYIRYNNVTYIVTAAIAIGDTLTIGTNIAVPTLDEGTVIYTPETGGSINGVVDVLVDGQSVVDENGEAHINTPNAGGIGYDNTESELEATNTQDAIDEVVDIVTDKVDKVVGKGLSTNDYDNTDKAKVGKIDETTTSASGNPISISGLKSNQLAINPIITLEPIQAGSGDPSPSNVRTISGYDSIDILSCGKNLVCKTLSSTGIYGGTIASDSNYDMHIAPIVKGTAYYISTEDNVNWFAGFFTSMPSVGSTPIDNSWIHTPSFTAPITGYVAFRSNHGYATPQCELGTSATTYEAPNKTTDLSLQIGQTVYGGTLDVETGVLTVDRGYISSNTIALYDSTYNVCTIATNIPNVNPSNNVAYDMISNAFQVYPAWDLHENISMQGIALDQNPNIWFRLTSASSQSDYETFLANHPVQVCYKFATPYTIQLTPHEISLLKDCAYVSTNGTNMQFSYKNGEMASLGDVAQLGQTVNELGEYVDRNNGGTQTEITSLSSYVIPHDGYITLDGGNNTSGVVRIEINGANNEKLCDNYMNITAIYQSTSIFVKRGMICIMKDTSGGKVWYRPII